MKNTNQRISAGRRVAIIGAGMAGMVCASRLSAAGFAVTVFEKSRGLGGRLATRRADALSFDHGAPSFGATSEPFRAFVDELSNGPKASISFWAEAPGLQAFVGLPSMNALLKPLAELVSVNFSKTVANAEKDADGWRLHLKDEDPTGTYDYLGVAVPAPQAIEIVHEAAVAAGASEARYAPCWTTLLACAPDALPDNPAPDADLFSAVIANDTKPGRPQGLAQIVLHARPVWSKANLEHEKDEIARTMADAYFNGATPELQHLAGHRWRYAFVEEPAGLQPAFDKAQKIGFAGDWRRGPTVEDAFYSGVELADGIIEAASA
ncbi:MAG: NAD(P)-binding protein [Pseudomonadota bacterium]